jgi:hypothetical protein
MKKEEFNRRLRGLTRIFYELRTNNYELICHTCRDGPAARRGEKEFLEKEKIKSNHGFRRFDILDLRLKI